MKASEIVHYLSFIPDEEDFVLIPKKQYITLKMLACHYRNLIKHLSEWEIQLTNAKKIIRTLQKENKDFWENPIDKYKIV